MRILADSRATSGTQTTGSTTTQVNYDYTPKGELEASTDGQNRKQTFDAWGHVTKSELFDGETSAGAQQYVYDATGRVARETSAFAVNNTETDLYYDQPGHVIVEDDTVIGQSTMPLTADRENVWGSDGSLLFVEDQNTAHPQRGAVREYAQQDAQGNTTSVVMPTLGSDFLPTVIDATFDGESVHLTGSATDGYIGTLADGSVISATPDASDPTMQSFKQTLEGAISDLGTWQWADGKWTATGNNDPGLTGLKTPFEVKERYVYDPRGLPTVLKSDWSGYDMSGGVPYGNNPKNSFNKSEITFRYLFGQQRWQGQTRLYETMGGGSYDPVLGASEQPRTNAANQAFNSYGWWGDFAYSFGGQLGQMANGINKLTNPVIGALSLAGHNPMDRINPYVIPGSGYNAHTESWRNDVGLDRMIPIWGSAKQAYYDFGHAKSDFANGQYFGGTLDLLTGLANTVQVATDALLVKTLLTGVARFATRATAEAGVEAAQLAAAKTETTAVAVENGAAQSTSSWKRAEVNGSRVYQRSDLIDPNLVDDLGRSNLQRMHSGLAPIGPDGESINLHHMLQTPDGPLAEMTHTFHQENYSTIHINDNSIPSGINRRTFNAWRRNYWETRAGDFAP